MSAGLQQDQELVNAIEAFLLLRARHNAALAAEYELLSAKFRRMWRGGQLSPVAATDQPSKDAGNAAVMVLLSSRVAELEEELRRLRPQA